MARSTAKDGLSNKIETAILTSFPGIWQRIQRHPKLSHLVNAALVNSAIYKIPPRPNTLSTMADYTSWDSLIDRTYSARHLPPSPRTRNEPPIDEIADLFVRREGKMIESKKSTVLFSYFAQWFTDGFLRTDYTNFLKNTSNHEIDLTPLYGLNRSVTNIIRSHEGGKLRSQIINGEEYPPFLYDMHGERSPDFTELVDKVGPNPQFNNEARAHFFAMGGDRSNVQIGYVAFNVLMHREHNRLCDLLHAQHPAWDDERLFQTARNICIVMIMRIVIEEYINHIAPYQFKFIFDSAPFGRQTWQRQNWMAVEFTLVYRWHGLVPDTIHLAGTDYPTPQTLGNNQFITKHGLGQIFEDASKQPAGEIGLFNTPKFLRPVEIDSIKMDRDAQLASYNDYRAMCKFPRVTAFNQISGNPEIQYGLKHLYKHVDNIELYPGLFAEDVREDAAVGALIGRLVGIDAFSQALTNPLLSPNIFTAKTFSSVGMQTIQETKTISDILHRNIPNTGRKYKVTLTRTP